MNALSLVTLTLLGVGTSLSSPVKAAELSKPIEEKLVRMSLAASHSQGYLSIIQMPWGIEGWVDTMGDRTKPWNVSESCFVTPNDDMKITDGGYLSANSTHFTNDSNQDMQLRTPAFEYKTTNSVTTTTTHSVEIGAESKMEMEFPIATSTVTLSAKYSFSQGKSNTESEEMTWKVPDQTIPVKAHSKIRVDWLLKQGIAKGSVTMKDKIKAMIPYKSKGNTTYGYGLGRLVAEPGVVSSTSWNKFVNEDRSKWKKLSTEQADYEVGAANYAAKYGTEMYLQVKDVSRGESHASIIATIPIKNAVSRPSF